MLRCIVFITYKVALGTLVFGASRGPYTGSVTDIVAPSGLTSGLAVCKLVGGASCGPSSILGISLLT